MVVHWVIYGGSNLTKGLKRKLEIEARMTRGAVYHSRQNSSAVEENMVVVAE